MDNQTAIDKFNKINDIRVAIFEATMTAIDNEDFDLAAELGELDKSNNKIWWRELENAYPTNSKVGA